MSSSCLAEHFANYIELNDGETAVLEDIEKTPENFSVDTIITDQDEPTSDLYIVRSGHLISYRYHGNGERQIIQIYFPGDIIGTASLATGNAPSVVRAITDVSLCRLPRERLGLIFQEQPRLAALLFALSSLNNLDLVDRLCANGHTNGKGRLAHLFLSLLTRVRLGSDQNKMAIILPLTQIDYSDVAGLSHIHVNRLIKEMTASGLISVTRSRVEINDEMGLRQLTQFENRFERIDSSWFPLASDAA